MSFRRPVAAFLALILVSPLDAAAQLRGAARALPQTGAVALPAFQGGSFAPGGLDLAPAGLRLDLSLGLDVDLALRPGALDASAPALSANRAAPKKEGLSGPEKARRELRAARKALDTGLESAAAPEATDEEAADLGSVIDSILAGRYDVDGVDARTGEFPRDFAPNRAWMRRGAPAETRVAPLDDEGEGPRLKPNRMFARSPLPAEPAKQYALAFAKAESAARGAGVAGELLFLEATTALPKGEFGWSYNFWVADPGGETGRTIAVTFKSDASLDMYPGQSARVGVWSMEARQVNTAIATRVTPEAMAAALKVPFAAASNDALFLKYKVNALNSGVSLYFIDGEPIYAFTTAQRGPNILIHASSKKASAHNPETGDIWDEAMARTPRDAKGGWLDALAYGLKRKALSLLAALGSLHSMPAVTDAHAARLKAGLDKRDVKVAYFDYDDTLEAFKQAASEETGRAFQALRAAGIQPVILTDRSVQARKEKYYPDTVMASLDALPAELKAGLIVAGNKGGQIVAFDAEGKPGEVEISPGYSKDELAAVADALREIAAEVGVPLEVIDRAEKGDVEAIDYTALKPGDESKWKVEFNEYAFVLIWPPSLTAKSKDEQLKIAQAAEKKLVAALDKRGFRFETTARTAYDPTVNPPYVTGAPFTKKRGIELVSKKLGLQDGRNAVVFGDAFLPPRNVDAGMVEAARGALAFAVGGELDPRLPGVYLWPSKGHAATMEIVGALVEAAQRRRARAPGLRSNRMALVNPFPRDVASLYPDARARANARLDGGARFINATTSLPARELEWTFNFEKDGRVVSITYKKRGFELNPDHAVSVVTYESDPEKLAAGRELRYADANLLADAMGVILPRATDHKLFGELGISPYRAGVSLEFRGATESNPQGLTWVFYADAGERIEVDAYGGEGRAYREGGVRADERRFVRVLIGLFLVALAAAGVAAALPLLAGAAGI